MVLCRYYDFYIACFGIWFGISNTCGGVRSNKVDQNRETDEEHDEDCVEEVFQLAKVNFSRDGERGSKALGIRNSVSIFEIFHILKTIFQYLYYLVIGIHQFLRLVSHWARSLVMKTFFNIFRSTCYWIWQVLFEYNLYPIYFL